jgi:hypothetical protein
MPSCEEQNSSGHKHSPQGAASNNARCAWTTH